MHQATRTRFHGGDPLALTKRIDSAKLRMEAKAARDRALADADDARTGGSESWLTWSEARHRAWMTYARTVFAVADR